MVNTEQSRQFDLYCLDYNILNIVVNTEPVYKPNDDTPYYNILNIVVNTEQAVLFICLELNYNILNIVVNTEPIMSDMINALIITY